MIISFLPLHEWLVATRWVRQWLTKKTFRVHCRNLICVNKISTSQPTKKENREIFGPISVLSPCRGSLIFLHPPRSRALLQTPARHLPRKFRCCFRFGRSASNKFARRISLSSIRSDFFWWFLLATAATFISAKYDIRAWYCDQPDCLIVQSKRLEAPRQWAEWRNQLNCSAFGDSRFCHECFTHPRVHAPVQDCATWSLINRNTHNQSEYPWCVYTWWIRMISADMKQSVSILWGTIAWSWTQRRSIAAVSAKQRHLNCLWSLFRRLQNSHMASHDSSCLTIRQLIGNG